LFLLCRFEDLRGKDISIWAQPRHHHLLNTNLERAKKAFVDAHHGTSIVKLATIVGRTKERDELTLGEELVAILNDLMGTADEIHVVFLEEPGYDVWSESERDTAVILAPPSDILIWIRP